MTAPVSSPPQTDEPADSEPLPGASLSIPGPPAWRRILRGVLWTTGLSLLALLLPRTAGRQLQRRELAAWFGLPLAAANLLLIFFKIYPLTMNNNVRDLLLYPKTFIVVSMTGGMVMLFFAVVPFAAQPHLHPHPNRYCLKHVLRTLWCGTSTGLVWILVMRATFHVVSSYQNLQLAYLDDVIVFTAMSSLLLIYSLWVLIRLVIPAQPLPTDFHPAIPHCDACSYILTGLDIDGPNHCPECGRLLRENFADSPRRLTSWELNPRFYRLPAFIAQMGQIIFRPQAFFEKLCLYSGHRASRRWLVLQITLVGLLASLIICTLRGVLGPEVVVMGPTSWQYYAVAISLGTFWAFLGLMMVGIETAGLAYIGHWHNQPLNFASASRITSYASTLLFFWVVMGGTQIILISWYVSINGPRRVGLQWDAIITTGSLFAAQIGGLLWFEYIVYHGRRFCQYSNR